MPSPTTLKRYIEKLDEVILSGDMNAAEGLQDEVLAVFDTEIEGLRSKLDNYAHVSMFSTSDGYDSPVPDVDFIKDARTLRERLQAELEKTAYDGREDMPDQKPHKLFISHSSKDKEYMDALVELLEDIGMPDGSFVCTSVPGHGIPI